MWQVLISACPWKEVKWNEIGVGGKLFHNIALQCKQELGDWHVVFIHAERKKKGAHLGTQHLCQNELQSAHQADINRGYHYHKTKSNPTCSKSCMLMVRSTLWVCVCEPTNEAAFSLRALGFIAIGCVKCHNLKGSWNAHRRWQCKNVTDLIPPSSTATSMYYQVLIEGSYCGIRQHSFNTVPQSIPWITEQHRAGGGSREQMVRQGGRCVSIMYLLSHAKYMSRNRSPRSAWRCCVKLHGKLQEMEERGCGFMCGAECSSSIQT